MATQRPVHIDSTSGNVRELVAGDKLGGVTNGTATGEALTFDAIGASVQAYDADLAAIAGLSTGLVAITGAGTAAARTILGTTNQVTVTNGNGASGNPTLSLPQSIDTASAVTFKSVTALDTSGIAQTLLVMQDSQTTSRIRSFSSKFIGWQNTTAASSVGFLNVANSGGLFVEERVSGATLTLNSIGALLPSGWQWQVKGSLANNQVVDYAGNTIIGGATVGSGAVANLVLSGGASRVLGAALADTSHQASPDNGAGNAEWQVQPESGGLMAYGADVLRRVPNANRNVDDRVKSVTTTDATASTVDTIAITASSTYLIKTSIVARRTGGTAGTADDGASYMRQATYTTKAGTVTLMGAVQVISTDAEDQILWDATLTISGANVLVRVTGASLNNVSWQAHTLVERIAS